MTPNKQLIFETREEAREYFGLMPDIKTDSFYNLAEKELFTQWLSEQNVIIKSEVKQ